MIPTPALVGTFLIDPPSMVALGVLITLAGARWVGTLRDPSSGVHTRIALIWGMWFGAWILPVWRQFPDWQWFYAIEPDKVPVPDALLFWGFVVFLGLSTWTGAALAGVFVGKGKPLHALGLALLFGAIWGLLTWAQWDQYTHVGTWAEFHAGSAIPIKESDLNGLMAVSGLMSFVPYGGILLWMHWKGRRGGV